jgi:hypothetical protein
MEMLKLLLQWQSLSTGLCTIRFREFVDLDNPPSLLDQGRAHANKVVNTSGKASAQILHLPLGDESSPLGDSAVGR